MNINFSRKIALITGGAGAIGSCTAFELARNGAIVFINDNNEENGEKIVNEITSKGFKAFFQKGDVTKEDDIKSFIDTALSKFGHIDILINNVGHNVGNDKRNPIFYYKSQDWNKVIDVCIDSLYFCCKYTIGNMIDRNYGKILNIGSVAGFNMPLQLQSPFNSAKSAVVNLTKSLALDYGNYQINVNAIVPGSIINEELKNIIYDTEEKTKSMLSHIPLGKVGKPIDIANAVLYLVSDEAEYVTGSVLSVDGGWSSGYSLDLE